MNKRCHNKISFLYAAFLSFFVVSADTAIAEDTCGDTAEAQQLIDMLLTDLTPVLNAEWPAIATATGLDPMMNVYDGDINIGCKYGGDEVCGLQASSCKKFYVKVDVNEIDGLAAMQFKNMAVTSINGASGTSCPYGSIDESGEFVCSYSGDGSASAYLLDGKKITANIKTIKAQVKCKTLWGDTFTETLWSGSANCKAGDPKGNAKLNYCAGSCASGSPSLALSYLQVKDLDINVGSLSCDVKPDYDMVSWIAEILVPELKKQIINAVTLPIKNALNDLLDDNIPYQSACGS